MSKCGRIYSQVAVPGWPRCFAACVGRVHIIYNGNPIMQAERATAPKLGAQAQRPVQIGCRHVRDLLGGVRPEVASHSVT